MRLVTFCRLCQELGAQRPTLDLFLVSHAMIFSSTSEATAAKEVLEMDFPTVRFKVVAPGFLQLVDPTDPALAAKD